MPTGAKSSYVRTSFSLTSESDALEAFRRLSEVILEAQDEVKASVQS